MIFQRVDACFGPQLKEPFSPINWLGCVVSRDAGFATPQQAQKRRA